MESPWRCYFCMSTPRSRCVTLELASSRKWPSEGDILIAALGRPALVGRDFIKPGAVIVDVGINRVDDPEAVRDYFGDDSARLAQLEEKGYTLVGDVHPREAQEVAGALTPVPGGVGPLTIAMLLVNTARLTRQRRLSS